MKTILITGMAGGLANVIATALKDMYRIIGVDSRPYRKRWPYDGKFIQVNYTKRVFSDIFRRYKPDKVLHLGRIADPHEKLYRRYNFNVMGTANILNLCDKYEVKTVVIFSTFHVYGAHQYNPANIEEEHPLRAGQIFPQIIDAVELDYLSTSYLWKNPSTRTVILRPCNIVGPNINNTMTRFLRRKFIPHLMGFDPMQQFIHEVDIAQAIKLVFQNKQVSGVFNLTGGGAVPIQKVIQMCQATPLPVPHYLAYPALGSLSIFGIGFPPHLIDYFRYPVVISDQKFRKLTGYANQMNVTDTLKYL